MELNENLKTYIEEKIFPEYKENDSAHSLSHINYVIRRSFIFAKTIPNINYNIVYTVAAYHDIGHHINPKEHEIISAKIMSEDKNLKQFFSSEELSIIKEAIEDHRASSNHEPRSIYGKIVSTADRNNTVEDCFERSYIYGKRLNPNATDEELFCRAYEHLKLKFGEKGYAKFYFKDEEYEEFLKQIRSLLSNKEKFIKIQQEYINKLKKAGKL